MPPACITLFRIFRLDIAVIKKQDIPPGQQLLLKVA